MGIVSLKGQLIIRRIRGILLATIFLSLGQIAIADDWSDGETAYASDDFSSALRHFETARRGGLDSPAVHYNIAVCHFKLGQLTEAASGFRTIANRFPKMRGLAEYNLGLVALRNNDNRAATQHFLNAHKHSADDRTIRILSSNRLREIAPDTHTGANWSGAIGTRVGFDDNVALRDETGLPSTLSAESPMADLFASVKGPFNGASGFRVDASLYIVRNFDADEFDQSELYGGVMYDWRSGDWRLQLGAHYSAGTLGGEAFDRKSGGNLTAIRYLDKNSELDLRYIYDNVQDADVVFSGIAGSRQQFQGQYRWYSGANRFRLRYRQEENDRLDPQVTPKRKTLSVNYRYQPAQGWGYEGGISYRSSRYDQLPVQRQEDLTSINLSVTRTIVNEWMLLIDYRFSKNDSSDPLFSYNRNVVTIGAMRFF